MPQITIRVTDDERKKYNALAKDSGIDLSSLIRFLLSGFSSGKITILEDKKH